MTKILRTSVCFLGLSFASLNFSAAAAFASTSADTREIAKNIVFQFPSGVTATGIWEVGPHLVAAGESILNLTFESNAGPVETETAPSLELTMPAMNHPGVPTSVTATGAGTFRISEIYFLMEGIWELSLTRIGPGGQTETAKVQLDLPAILSGDCHPEH